MNDNERYEALTDLLEYCRDPQHVLSAGRQLGPVLLGKQSPAPSERWTSDQDDALAEQLAELLKAQLVSSRQMAGLATSAPTSPAFHRRVLKQDMAQRYGELPFWSLLWAYYICQVPAEEIGRICGWELHQSQRLVEQGRRTCLSQKLATLEQEGVTAGGQSHQSQERVSIDARDQRISGNQGIAINGNVSDSTVQQHTIQRRLDPE